MNDRASFIGESAAFLRTLERASQVAPLPRPVLIIGERGTGKERIVERIHYLSPRWEQVLVKVNCAALPESLLEAELFGYERGAFTGAEKRHFGRFERAEGGTLFLDEIASMSLRLQEKLLRVVEYGEFERVGGRDVIMADVRVIGAANADLPEMARRGRFRADLLDRLSFDVITLPPLRCRKEDVPLLAEHFALNMVKELKRDFFPGFTAQAMKALSDYSWPGNVRELKNVVERAVYRSPDGELIDSLEFDPFSSPWALKALDEKNEKPRVERAAPPDQKKQLPYDFKKTVAEFEVALLRDALRQSRYSQRKTAGALGLTYHQLRGYLRKYGLIERPGR